MLVLQEVALVATLLNFGHLITCVSLIDGLGTAIKHKSVEFRREATCPPGFKIEQDGKCIDEDECRNINICHGLRCQNTPGSYRCEEYYLSDEPGCEEGFRKKPGRFYGFSCLDIDECEENSNICGERECQNTIGSYKCGKSEAKEVENSDCAPGQKQGTYGCQDINECEENPKVCGEQKCENTPGSYKCVDKSSIDSPVHVLPKSTADVSPMVDCKPGYKIENGRCEDVDECVDMFGACPMRMLCENTPGSYKCTEPTAPPTAVSPDNKPITCQPGYRKDGDGCKDIDECSEGSRACRRDQECKNTVGSFECKCPFGTEEKKGVCQRGDPCHPNPCSHTCTVAARGYNCSCPDGLKLGPNKRSCIDINECLEGTHLCSHTCTNTVSSYECSCPDGHDLTDGIICKPKKVVPNSEEKEPIVPAYTPSKCSIGSYYDPQTGRCEFENRCVRWDGICQECKRGYFLDTMYFQCIDIDECAWGFDDCGSRQCTNTEGSYICGTNGVRTNSGCLVRRCYPGFVYDGAQSTCVDMDECKQSRKACAVGETCINAEGAYFCQLCRKTELGENCSLRKKCPEGMVASDFSMHACQDKNECQEDPRICPTGKVCVNTVGSYCCT